MNRIISVKKAIEFAFVAAAAFIVFMGMATAEESQIEKNMRISSPEVIFFENFESGWNGWYADNGVWQVGIPTAGPARCYNGTQCAGTNLSGNYPPITASKLISPSIQLPVVSPGEEIHIRFGNWFSYAYHNWGHDYGVVQVSVYNASTNTWDGFKDVGSSVYGSSPYWSEADRDVTQYAGKKIRIAFQHVDENSWSGQSTGWYIDDVQITKGVPVFTGDFESGWDGWSAETGIWQVGTPTAGPTRCYNGTQCAGTNLSGNYPPITASRLISPSIQLPVVSPGEEIHIRFGNWFSYAYHNWGHDYGVVQVSVYNASTNTWDGFKDVGSSVYGSSPYWSQADRDVTQYAGKKIRIAFQHVDENSWSGQSTGWYIDDVQIIGVKFPPTISIATDKSKYTPGDIMVVTYNIANPTSEPVRFEWYIGAPQKNIWLTYNRTIVPAGYNGKQVATIPVGNWGSTPFGIMHYVHLLNSSSGDILSQDSSTLGFSPGSVFAGDAQVDIEKEIMKTRK